MGLEYDQQHVQEILEDPCGKRWSWWSCHVIRLAAKADRVNRELLRSAFPRHVEVYERWDKGLPPLEGLDG